MNPFFQALRTQRWDDHRYYHHDRINQSLHLLSAVSFVIAYVWLLIDPVVSALIGWLMSMTTRQAGHFFFEPHDYDAVNQATHAFKEEIKVAVLVASIRLHFVDVLLHLRYPGPNRIDCRHRVSKGQELGWFEHGSTIIVLAPPGCIRCAGIEPGTRVRMGQPLLRLPRH